MIRVLLGQKGKLVRQAIATVLSGADDIRVTAELSQRDDVLSVVQREAVDVAILDARLPGTTLMTELCEKLTTQCSVLVLTDPEDTDRQWSQLARLAPRVGFIATESSPETLIDNVRRAARGELVIDTKLALAALKGCPNPLTEREREVLTYAAEGLSAPEIGRRLFLSPGTVRNHLSRIMTKTGTRTRIAAIRHAQAKGWI